MPDFQIIKIMIITAVFFILCLLVFILRFQGLVSNIKNVNLFKDGRNVPLSLAIVAVFLAWSLNSGSLSQMPFFFQLLWSLLYVYFMIQYRYTLKSLFSRSPLILLLLILKKVVSEGLLSEGLFFYVAQVLAPQGIFLYSGLLLTIFSIDTAQMLLVSFVSQRDYWALLLLALPGISVEYTYWQQKDALMLGMRAGVIVSGTLEDGVRLGELIKQSLQGKRLGEYFKTFPLNTQILRHDIIIDATYKLYSSNSRFGVLPQQLVSEEFFISMEGPAGFYSIRNKIAALDTRTLEGFMKAFSTRYPGIFKGLGEKYAFDLPRYMVQQSYHLLATEAVLRPEHPLFAHLLDTNEALGGKKSFGTKSMHTFCLSAVEQYLTKLYIDSDLKVVGVLRTPLDCALLVKDSNGWVKSLAIEAKSYANLERLAVYFGIDGGPTAAVAREAFTTSFFTPAAAGKFDEVVLIAHTIYKPTVLERENFKQSFFLTYPPMKFKYKLVFM